MVTLRTCIRPRVNESEPTKIKFSITIYEERTIRYCEKKL